MKRKGYQAFEGKTWSSKDCKQREEKRDSNSQ